MIDDEVDESEGQADLFADLVQVLQVVGAFFGLVEVFILQKHNGNGQVEHEEGADDDAQQEVEVYEPGVIGILKHVAYIDPALERDTLEYRQKCYGQVVEICKPVVQILNFGVTVEILNKRRTELVSSIICSIGFCQRPAPSIYCALPLAGTEERVCFINFPVTVHREFCQSASHVDGAFPKRHTQNRENDEEKHR